MEISRFTVSPTPNALPANTAAKGDVKSEPLHIITQNRSSSSDCDFDDIKLLSSTKVLSIMTTPPLASLTSPANSLDSGVSSPSYDLLCHSSTNSTILSPSLITYSSSTSTCSTFSYQRHHHRSSYCICGEKHQVMSCEANSKPLFNNSSTICAVRGMDCRHAFGRSRSSSLTLEALSSLFSTNSLNRLQSDNESIKQSFNNNNNQLLLTSNSLNSKARCNNDLLIEKVNDNFVNTSRIFDKAESDAYLNCSKKLSNSLTSTSNQILCSTNSVNCLKGILKKPSCDCLCCGNILRSQQHLRQTNPATRFCLSRSVSESGNDYFNHSDFGLSNAFNEMMIDSGKNLPICSEVLFEDDDEFLKSLTEDTIEEECNCDSSLNAEAGNESWDEPGNIEISIFSFLYLVLIGKLVSRKKRVSFSDHVQARIYRSNSSIVGQKKKNERKNRVKRRRSESENTVCWCSNMSEIENKVCFLMIKLMLKKKLLK